ncbi:MAG: hypothetical protein KatS3mg051_1445 [Anaerolineae bacterium]|nr:MAG: hypothetical protein KatS3mg051_1445 [Anaerolineae bacterium]
MRRLAEAALGALVGAGLVLVTGASATATPRLQSDGWRVVGVVVEDGAGQRFTLPLAGVETPLSTATPPPTNTPRPEPTVTASVTPAPDTPTPTQETTALPPLTPRPTNPPPDEAVCMAGVKTSALNVRADPSTAAAVVGKLAQGERVQIEAVFVRYPEGSVNREEWGRLADGRGWIALWYAGAQLAVLDDSPACWEIPISYASAKPASLFGLHLIHSARTDVGPCL